MAQFPSNEDELVLDGVPCLNPAHALRLSWHHRRTCRNEGAARAATLGSQLSAVRFYEKLGSMRKEGPVFLDAGIEHVWMTISFGAVSVLLNHKNEEECPCTHSRCSLTTRKFLVAETPLHSIR